MPGFTIPWLQRMLIYTPLRLRLQYHQTGTSAKLQQASEEYMCREWGFDRCVQGGTARLEKRLSV